MNLTGEQKEINFLAAYAAVAKGTACWLNRWHAVTYGRGPEGADGRFDERGKLSGPKIKRPRDPEAVAREKARKR